MVMLLDSPLPGSPEESHSSRPLTWCHTVPCTLSVPRWRIWRYDFLVYLHICIQEECLFYTYKRNDYCSGRAATYLDYSLSCPLLVWVYRLMYYFIPSSIDIKFCMQHSWSWIDRPATPVVSDVIVVIFLCRRSRPAASPGTNLCSSTGLVYPWYTRGL